MPRTAVAISSRLAVVSVAMFTLRRSRSLAAWTLVLALCAALSTGCFGYNPSAKRTAYVGNSLLIVGGGATLAAELLLAEDDGCPAGIPTCMETDELSPITGPMVVGTMLITAGLVGIVLNLTRPTAKNSR
jgi:hypothetical protein